MKILHINCVYGYGSTGKIIEDVKRYLQGKGHLAIVAFGNGVAVNEEGTYLFCNRWEVRLTSFLVKIGRLRYSGLWLPTHRLIKYIESEKPDVVHIHCLNGYCADLYKTLKYLAIHDIRTVVTHHAEFYYTGSCPHAYDCQKWKDGSCGPCPYRREATAAIWADNTRKSWKKMREAFSLFKPNKLQFTAVSPWVMNRSLLSPIVNGFPVEVVMNGVNTRVFHFRTMSSDNPLIDFQKEMFIFHATASFNPGNKEDNKGGWVVCEMACRFPQILFIVACNEYFQTARLPRNVKVVGRIVEQLYLAEAYSTARITLITSRRETFSMVTAESFCCGTPVVGFKAGGPESIAIPEYSSFVDYGDVNQLEASLREMLCRDVQKSDLSKAACCIFSSDVMSEKYLNAYRKLTCTP